MSMTAVVPKALYVFAAAAWTLQGHILFEEKRSGVVWFDSRLCVERSFEKKDQVISRMTIIVTVIVDVPPGDNVTLV